MMKGVVFRESWEDLHELMCRRVSRSTKTNHCERVQNSVEGSDQLLFWQMMQLLTERGWTKAEGEIHLLDMAQEELFCLSLYVCKKWFVFPFFKWIGGEKKRK